MKTIYENETIQIMIAEESPLIISEVFAMPENIEVLRKATEVQLHLIESMVAKYKSEVYCICDGHSLQAMSFDMLVLYFLNIIPKQIKHGLTFNAFVKPNQVTSLESQFEIIKNFGSLPAGLFDTRTQALSFIDTEWSKTQKQLHRSESIMAEKQRSIL